MQDKIISLASKRKDKNKVIAQSYKDPDERIRELEEDALKLIDTVLDMEQRLYNQERYLRKLMHLLLAGVRKD